MEEVVEVVETLSAALRRAQQHHADSTGLLVTVLVALTFLLAVLRARLGSSEAEFSASRLGSICTLIMTVVTFLLFLLILPLAIGVLAVVAVYRWLVQLYLKRTLRQSFSGLLVGPDVMWAIEHPTSKSIINVLAVVEVPKQRSIMRRHLQDSTEECTEAKQLLRLVRKIALSRLMASPLPFPKLLHKRVKSPLGYFYWESTFDKCVEKYVRSLDVVDHVQSGVTLDQLKTVIGDYANKDLPDHNASTWEILVGRQPILHDSSKVNHHRKILKFPVLFRIHHSLGDGVSLMRLLLECLADRYDGGKAKEAKEKQKDWYQASKKFHDSEDLEYDPMSTFDTEETHAYHPVLPDKTEKCEKSDPQRTLTKTPELQIIIGEDDDPAEPVVEYKQRSSSPALEVPRYDKPEVEEPGLKVRSGSFRMLKLSPFKSLKTGLGSPTKLLREKARAPYSPIKGLGTGSIISKLPIIKKLGKKKELGRSMATDAESEAMNKTTCVVLPQPRRHLGGDVRTAPLNLHCGSSVYYYNKGDERLHNCLQAPAGLQRARSASSVLGPRPFLETNFDAEVPTHTVKDDTGFLETHFSVPGPVVVKESPRRVSMPSPKTAISDDTFKKCSVYKKSAVEATAEPVVEVPVPKEAIQIPEVANCVTVDQELPQAPQSSTKKVASCVQKAWNMFLLSLSLVIVFGVSIKNSLQALFNLSGRTTLCLLKAIHFVFVSPFAFWCQIMSRNRDTFLFGKRLTGEKVVAIYTEEETLIDSEKLLKRIQKVRSKLGRDVRFSDCLFTCLSLSLEKYYSANGAKVPEFINVVVPARMDVHDLSKGMQTTAVYRTDNMVAKVTRLQASRKALKKPFQIKDMSFSTSTESEDETLQLRNKAEKIHECMSKPTNVSRMLTLDNKFTVALLRLPVRRDVKETKAVDRLWRVKARYDALRSSPTFLLNYWLLRFVSYILPDFLLRPLVADAPSTMVVSNLPGPEDPVDLSGNNLRNIVFWIPNRGITGVGISVLSYGGRLSLGLMADKAFLPSQQAAQNLLDNLVQELHRVVDMADN